MRSIVSIVFRKFFPDILFPHIRLIQPATLLFYSFRILIDFKFSKLSGKDAAYQTGQQRRVGPHDGTGQGLAKVHRGTGNVQQYG